jgi:hypothetical protein
MHYYTKHSPNSDKCWTCGKTEEEGNHYPPPPRAVLRSIQWMDEHKDRKWPDAT